MTLKQRLCFTLNKKYSNIKGALLASDTHSDKVWSKAKWYLFFLSLMKCERDVPHKTWEDERRKIQILFLKRKKGNKIT